ncbi:hypothetical protein VQH23_16160 [Pararoseomonas sp. SCSIO 73927]|uniref:hypothetical protein n=1 Tax=Pararoseomonas sp. SCSIO 73927 TaxID=3114537 RepID=UPI0030CB1FA4
MSETTNGVEVLVGVDGQTSRVAGRDLGPAELETLIWRLMAARAEMLPRRLPVEFVGERIVLGVTAAVRRGGDGQELTCILTPAGWMGAVMPPPVREAGRSSSARARPRASSRRTTP